MNPKTTWFPLIYLYLASLEPARTICEYFNFSNANAYLLEEKTKSIL